MKKDMTTGRPLSLIVRFALPMMLGSLFQQLYNVINMYVVGNTVGSHALAAIGATSAASFFALTLVTGLTTGFTAVASKFHGAKDERNVKKTFASSIYIGGTCMLLLFLFGVFGAEPLLRLQNTPDDILGDAALYLRIYVGGSIGYTAYNTLSSILRAVGDSRTPLIFLIVTSLINVALDFFAVWVLKAGVAGVAIATVLSQTLSAIACAVYMLKKYDVFRLRGSDFHPDRNTMLKILRIGLPVVLQSVLLAIGDMTITSTVNAYGTDVVAAFATGQRVMQFSMMFCMNLSMAFAVFAGQNLGANQIGRIKRGFRDAFVLVSSICVVMTGLVFAFGDSLVRFFISSTDAHIDQILLVARGQMRTTAAFYIFLGLIWLYNNTLRNMGDVLIPFLSGITELVLKVGLSIALSRYFGYIGIWFAMPAGWVLGMIPSVIRFHTGGWRKLALGAP